MTFGETLSNLRKAKGLSQEQLAEELGLTRQTISKWELNQSTPDIDYLLQLSNFFDVSTDYLIKGEKIMELSVSDIIHSESNGKEHSKIKPNNIRVYKWYFLGFGCVGLSLIGIIIFVICSVIHPCLAMTDNGDYTGLIGFLIVTETVQYFIILSVIFIVGCLLAAYGIVINVKSKQ